MNSPYYHQLPSLALTEKKFNYNSRWCLRLERGGVCTHFIKYTGTSAECLGWSHHLLTTQYIRISSFSALLIVSCQTTGLCFLLTFNFSKFLSPSKFISHFPLWGVFFPKRSVHSSRGNLLWAHYLHLLFYFGSYHPLTQPVSPLFKSLCNFA